MWRACFATTSRPAPRSPTSSTAVDASSWCVRVGVEGRGGKGGRTSSRLALVAALRRDRHPRVDCACGGGEGGRRRGGPQAGHGLEAAARVGEEAVPPLATPHLSAHHPDRLRMLLSRRLACLHGVGHHQRGRRRRRTRGGGATRRRSRGRRRGRPPPGAVGRQGGSSRPTRAQQSVQANDGPWSSRCCLPTALPPAHQ